MTPAWGYNAVQRAEIERAILAENFRFPGRYVKWSRRWDRAPLRARLRRGMLFFPDQGKRHDA